MEIEDALAALKLVKEATAKRLRHEQDLARTGRGFWETHNIDEWAATAVGLKSQGETKADWALLMAELPDAAIGPLWERIDRMELDAERERHRRADQALEARARSPATDGDDDFDGQVPIREFRSRGLSLDGGPGS
jgi:hypothetical protein